MRRIDRPTDVEIDVGRFLEEQAADQRRAVAIHAPVAVLLVLVQHIPGVFDHLVDRNHALRHQINALDLRNRRHVARLEIQASNQRLVQEFRHDRRRGAAAHNVLALLGKEEREHPVAVVGIARRAEEYVHRLAAADADGAGRRVVAGNVLIQAIALVDEQRRQRLGRVADVRERRHVVDDVLALPAEIVGRADARVRTAVAHGDQNVVLLKIDHRLVDQLAVDVQLFLAIFVILAVAQENDVRIVVLYQLRRGVVDQVDDRKRRIGHAAHRADRQRRRDRLDALLQRQALRHHRGDDLRGQRREDARLHAAAQSVGQNDDRGILIRLHNVNVIAAQLLAIVIDALPADVCAQIIHC